MRKKIFMTMAFIAIIFVTAVGCGSGNVVNGSIEGTWVDFDSIVELTLSESEFMIVRYYSGEVIEGTFFISDDEIKFVTEFVDGIASTGEQIHSFLYKNDTIIIDEMEILTRMK